MKINTKKKKEFQYWKCKQLKNEFEMFGSKDKISQLIINGSLKVVVLNEIGITIHLCVVVSHLFCVTLLYI